MPRARAPAASPAVRRRGARWAARAALLLGACTLAWLAARGPDPAPGPASPPPRGGPGGGAAPSLSGREGGPGVAPPAAAGGAYALCGLTWREGRPVPAALRLWRIEPADPVEPAVEIGIGEPRIEERGRTASDAQGRFRFDALPAGRYAVAAEAQDGTRATEAAVLSATQAEAVVALDLTAPLHEVRGRVRTALGAPWRGRVAACRDPGLWAWSSAPLPGDPAPVETDAEGRFVLRGVTPGWARVVALGAPAFRAVGPEIDVPAADPVELVLPVGGAVSPGRVRDAVTGQPVGGARVRAFASTLPGQATTFVQAVSGADGRFALPCVHDPTDVLVEAEGYATQALGLLGGSALLDVRLARGSRLVGRLVRAADGAPLPRVGLVAEGFQGVAWARLHPRAVSDADGRFTFEGLAPASYTLDLEDPDWTLDPQRVEVGGPGRPRGLRPEPLLLEALPALRLRVTVVDPAGRPVPGARIHVYEAEADAGGRQELLASARTGTEGLGEVRPRAPAAAYLVRASAEGWSDGLAEALPRAAGVDLQVALRPARALDVLVRTEEGEPVAGARVGASSGRLAQERTWARCDAQGRARLDLLAALAPDLAVRADGFEESWRWLTSEEVEDAGLAPVVVVLAPEPRDPPAPPPPDPVEAARALADDRPPAEDRWLPEPGLPEPGPSEPGPSEPGEAAPATPRARVRLRVLDPEGQPVAGVEVRASWEVEVQRLGASLPLTASATSNVLGLALLEGALPGDGSVGLTLSPPSARRDLLFTRVPRWDPAQQELRLRPALVVEGRVLDERDQPVPGVAVGVVAPEADPRADVLPRFEQAAAVTDAAGRFRLGGLTEGPLTLCAASGRFAAQAVRGLEFLGPGLDPGLVVPEPRDHLDEVVGPPVPTEAGARGVVLRLALGRGLRVRLLRPGTLPRRLRAWLTPEHPPGAPGSEVGEGDMGWFALLTREDRAFSAPFGEGGEARFRFAPEGQRYTLWVGPLPDGSAAHVRGLTAGTAPVEVRAEHAGSISGRVLVEGEPAAGVHVRPSDDSIVQVVLTDSRGRFVLRGLPAGRQGLIAFRPLTRWGPPAFEARAEADVGSEVRIEASLR